MEKFRWGIIGCGDVCEVKSGPALQKANGSELVAVCRRQADKAEDFAKRHRVPRWTSDPQAIIDDPEVDVVYVATPPGSHAQYAIQVAAAGKPCYVEKPMARSHQECVGMNQAFAEAGQKLFVAYYRRRLPRFVAIKQWMDDGQLGDINSFDIVYTSNAMAHIDQKKNSWRFNPAISGGGLFFDLGSHALDILDMLLGPVVEAKGRASGRVEGAVVEDRVSATFTHQGGAIGAGLWDFASNSDPMDRVVIRGSKGSVEFAIFQHQNVSLNVAGTESLHTFSDPPHVHQPLVQTIVDELHDKGTCPSTGVSAARTSLIMDRLTQNFYGGQKV